MQAVLGGNESPNADDIKGILDSGTTIRQHLWYWLVCQQRLLPWFPDSTGISLDPYPLLMQCPLRLSQTGLTSF